MPSIVAVLVLMFPAALLPFGRSKRPEDRNPLNPARLYLLYLLLQVSVSGLIAILVVPLAATFTPDPATNQGVYLVSAALGLAAIVAFNVGYWNTSRALPSPPRRLMVAWDEARQTRLVLFLFALGYAAAAGLVVSAGGLAAMLANRENFRGGGIIGKGYLVYPMTSGLAVGALLAIDALLRRPASPRRNLWMAVVVVSAMIPAVLTGFRGLILLPIAMIGIYFHYNVRSLANRRGMLRLGALLVVFTAYGVYRALPEEIDPVKALEVVAATQPTLFFGPLTRTAGLEATAQIVKTMESDPRVEPEWFLPGAFETATVFVPQAVWPDKPEPTGNRLGRVFFLNDLRAERGADWDNPGGVSPTLIGWGYWQGGLVGLALFSFTTGWLLQRVTTVQRQWGGLPAVRIGFAFFAPSLFLSAEFPQNYANTLFQNVIVWLIIVSWMTRGGVRKISRRS